VEHDRAAQSAQCEFMRDLRDRVIRYSDQDSAGVSGQLANRNSGGWFPAERRPDEICGLLRRRRATSSDSGHSDTPAMEQSTDRLSHGTRPGDAYCRAGCGVVRDAAGRRHGFCCENFALAESNDGLLCASVAYKLLGTGPFMASEAKSTPNLIATQSLILFLFYRSQFKFEATLVVSYLKILVVICNGPKDLSVKAQRARRVPRVRKLLGAALRGVYPFRVLREFEQ
jgi:hypothetical protein